MKDTFIAYIRPSDGVVADVVLMDRDFSIKIGRKDTGINNGLLISNLTRCVSGQCILGLPRPHNYGVVIHKSNLLFPVLCVCVCVHACIGVYGHMYRRRGRVVRGLGHFDHV